MFWNVIWLYNLQLWAIVLWFFPSQKKISKLSQLQSWNQGLLNVTTSLMCGVIFSVTCLSVFIVLLRLSNFECSQQQCREQLHNYSLWHSSLDGSALTENGPVEMWRGVTSVWNRLQSPSTLVSQELVAPPPSTLPRQHWGWYLTLCKLPAVSGGDGNPVLEPLVAPSL